MRLLNGGLFDDEPRAGAGDHAASNAERECERRTGGMTRGKSDEHRAWEIAEQIGHHRAGSWLPARLVALRKLADDDGVCASQDPRLFELRDEAIDSVRSLAHFIQPQHE